MTLHEIYIDKKQFIDDAYIEMYNTIQRAIEQDEEYQLDTDSENELITDLMLSHILGHMTSYEELQALLNQSNN